MATLVGVVVVVVRPKTVWCVSVIVTAFLGAASRSWGVSGRPEADERLTTANIVAGASRGKGR